MISSITAFRMRNNSMSKSHQMTDARAMLYLSGMDFFRIEKSKQVPFKKRFNNELSYFFYKDVDARFE